MASPIKKTPAPPGVATWVLVTLLWGTLFYWTSIFMLRLASAKLGQGYFNAQQSELFTVYGIHAGVLVLFALVAMMVRQLLDPGASKQVARKVAIAEGKGEKVFISFAGSIATSFFFTGLTALTLAVSSSRVGFDADFTLPVVLLAASYNIAAGLCASLFVGVVFLIAQAVRKGT
ncbi:hypothetical protein [Chlorobium ferrooxidans]|uniref:Uncharacterized protein n=1 Tax=Chlorobium ferrooxidans DSM 13031 TaxID=377431 RepID=Q0YUL9_9CHLB|nr:hypothetical protein [Chlorobium ferrooxidans]EAT60013.1 conserved hypothetical protein [Chlorobium ferrooxidans DSM 13031]